MIQMLAPNTDNRDTSDPRKVGRKPLGSWPVGQRVHWHKEPRRFCERADGKVAFEPQVVRIVQVHHA